MAEVTGLTAERMLEIEAAAIVDVEIVGDELIFSKHDGSTINSGSISGVGSIWYSGDGSPAGGLGSITHWYLDRLTGDIYEKTGATTWTLRSNLTGPAGASGVEVKGKAKATNTVGSATGWQTILTVDDVPLVAGTVMFQAQVNGYNRAAANKEPNFRVTRVGDTTLRDESTIVQLATHQGGPWTPFSFPLNWYEDLATPGTYDFTLDFWAPDTTLDVRARSLIILQ